MLAHIEITLWHWVGFVACVLVFLALDLGVFHRTPKAVSVKQAFCWTILWIALAMAFAGALVPLRGKHEATEFVAGYFIELSLSMDNVFVIALIFTYFKIPSIYQHRVLFWGIMGALVMRGVMIFLGIELINRFEWLLYLLGAFLVFTGVKMLLSKDHDTDPSKGIVLRTAKRFFPVSSELDGQKFFTKLNGTRALTPLFLVLLAVETSDLLFAVDSIPAIFGVTRKPFIVFTSNVFAILGLRSLYFMLAGAIGLFRYLKYGLSLVLVFIGVKMLIDPHDHPPKWFQVDIPDFASLVFVLIILAISILASIIVSRREAQSNASSKSAER